jgi:Phage Mu protein F like protein
MKAQEVKANLVSSGAVKIRAALANSVKSDRIVAGYMDTHPVKSDNLAQDATRARAWCIAHVSYDFDALKLALKKHFANLYAFGLNDGAEKLNKALRSAVKAEKGTVVSAKIDHNAHSAKLDPAKGFDPNKIASFSIDWKSWEPGNEAAALLLKTPGGLSNLLGDINMQTKMLEDTSNNLMGTALAKGIAAGKTPVQIANDIRDSISHPARALTIALTEGSRAAVEANKQAFLDNGVSQWEWTVTDPEDEDCLDVEGEIVNVGELFSNGYDQPPVHPNCQCSVEPTMPDLSEYPAIDLTTGEEASPDYTGYEDL